MTRNDLHDKSDEVGISSGSVQHVSRLDPDVIMIRGAHGIGKTAVARELIRDFGKGAVIEVDHLRAMRTDVSWRDTEQHLLALKNAGLLTSSFVQSNVKPVIVVDTFSRGKLREFISAVSQNHVILSLWADTRTLFKRMENRPQGEYRDRESAKFLNDEIEADRYPNEILIDTSLLSPSEVAAKAISILRSRGLGNQNPK